MSLHETYLGDGLYASFDGFMITLRAPRERAMKRRRRTARLPKIER